ncbi:DMT family transporter [Amycolatopsis acidicola]|uniref:DMT family transporter n=1 Tax=Amycolatopsis acidicola TaxID=2596893 RepID=UPI00140B36AA|nr:SMR family transporter [Amycolatopsis acidicola]
MTLLLLAAAVLTQAIGITATRAADGLRKPGWVVVALVGIGASVALMSRALAHGLPFATGYGIWSGAGVACAALSGAVLFGDRLARGQTAGLVLVVAGVMTVYSGGS